MLWSLSMAYLFQLLARQTQRTAFTTLLQLRIYKYKRLKSLYHNRQVNKQLNRKVYRLPIQLLLRVFHKLNLLIYSWLSRQFNQDQLQYRLLHQPQHQLQQIQLRPQLQRLRIQHQHLNQQIQPLPLHQFTLIIQNQWFQILSSQLRKLSQQRRTQVLMLER